MLKGAGKCPFKLTGIGGVKAKISALLALFDFNFLVQNILKEGDINFFFKVFAKFGGYKHNEDIKKDCGN